MQLNLPKNPLQPFAQYKIGSQAASSQGQYISNQLGDYLEKATGSKFTITTSRTSGDYTRYTIVRQGFHGPNTLVFDMRAGAESAYEDENTGKTSPSFAIKLGGTQETASEAVVGLKLTRHNEGWMPASPGRALSDIIAGAFISTANRFADRPNDPRLSVRGEMMSLLTEGTERHSAIRERFNIPTSHPMNKPGESQGSQIQNALRIGVAFDPAEEQYKQQQDLESMLALSPIANSQNRSDYKFFERLLNKGMFGLSRAEDRSLGVHWIAAARHVNHEWQTLMHGGGNRTDWLVGRQSPTNDKEYIEDVISRTPILDAIAASMKHIKNKTLLQRSRDYVQPFARVKDSSGNEILSPINPATIDEMEAQYGPAYWNKSPGAYIQSGIIEAGEQHPRTLHVMRTAFTPTPISGGAFIDESLLKNVSGYGMQTAQRTSLDFSTIADIVETNFKIRDQRGKSIYAGERATQGIIQYGALGTPQFSDPKQQRAWQKERTVVLATQGAPRDQQIQGMTLRLPQYYNPVNDMLFAGAEERNGQFFIPGTQTELRHVSTDPRMRALAADLGKRGVSIDYSYENRGGEMETRLVGDVGAALKSVVKSGMILRQSSTQMGYTRDSGGRSEAIDIVTGEVKDAAEVMKGTFRVQTFNNRVNMLRMLGKMKIGGKSVDVGGQLADWAKNEFAGSRTMSVDSLVDKYREITQINTATEENIWLGLFQRLDTMTDTEAHKWAKSFGVKELKGGWIDAGYFAPGLAKEMQAQQEALLASTPGSKALFKFVESDNKNFKTMMLRVNGRDVAPTGKQLLRSVLMPMGSEMAVEWGGNQDALNFESTASLARVLPELAEALRVRPEDPPPTGGKPGTSAASRSAWINMMKAFALNDAGKRGMNVEYEGQMILDRNASGRLMDRLSVYPEDKSVDALKEIDKFLTEEYNAQNNTNVSSVPSDTVIKFGKTGAYVTTPDVIRGTDIFEASQSGQRSTTAITDQYVRAVRDLASYESANESGGRQAIDSYSTFMGNIGSRLGQLFAGKSVTDILVSKVVNGSIYARYFAMPTLEAGQAYLPAKEERRLGIATGDKNLFSATMRRLGGKIMGALQRDPIISQEEGTVPVEVVNNQYMKEKGLKDPNIPWSTGTFGLSLQSSLALVGDFDFDPARLIVHPGEDVQRAVYRTAMAKRFKENETYTSALRNVLRDEANKYNVLRSAIAEGVDPTYSPFKSALKTGWAPLNVASKANTLYSTGSRSGGGIMPLRGISYDTFDYIKAALTQQVPGTEGAALEAIGAFTAQYQKTLETNLEAAQETPLQAILQYAKISTHRAPGQAQGIMQLSTVTNPRDVSAYAIRKESEGDMPLGWKNITTFGPEGDQQETGGSREMWTMLAGQSDITDAMLASIAASSTGTDAWRDNTAKILSQLTRARKFYGDRAKTEKDWVKFRASAMRGDVAGFKEAFEGEDTSGALENLFDTKIAGKDTVLHLSMLSRALEKNIRDIDKKPENATDWHAMNRIVWKGKAYSQSELYEHPDFVADRYARSMLMAKTIDPGRAAFPSADVAIDMMDRLNDTMLGKAMKSAISRMGFKSYKQTTESAITTEALDALVNENAPSLRGSEISSVISEINLLPEEIKAGGYNAQRNALTKKQWALKALTTSAMRNLVWGLGERETGELLRQDAPTRKMERGNIFEKFLEVHYPEIIRGPEGDPRDQRHAGSFLFKYQNKSGGLMNTVVRGTPDFLQLTFGDSEEEDWLDVVEAKKYGETAKGEEMALIQATIYREGLMNMTKGISGYKDADSAELLKEKLFRWYHLANEQRKKNGLEAIDFETYSRRAFGAISRGRVGIRALVGADTDIDDDISGFRLKSDLSVKENFTPTSSFIDRYSAIMKGDIGFFAKLLRAGMQNIQGRPGETVPGTEAGAGPGVSKNILSRMPSVIREIESLDVSTGASWVDRGWSQDSAMGFGNQFDLASRNIAVLGDIGHKRLGAFYMDKARRTLVKPGENVRDQMGRVSVVLGDTDAQGDTTSLAEAKLVDKSIIDTVKLAQSKLGGEKEAHNKAVELVSQHFDTHKENEPRIRVDPNAQGRSDLGSTLGSAIQSAVPVTAGASANTISPNLLVGPSGPGGGGTGSGGTGTGSGAGGYPSKSSMDKSVEANEALQSRLYMMERAAPVFALARSRLEQATNAPAGLSIDELISMVPGGTREKRQALGTDVVQQLTHLRGLVKSSKAAGYSTYTQELTQEQTALFETQAQALGISLDSLKDSSGMLRPSSDIIGNAALLGLAPARQSVAAAKKQAMGDMTRAGFNAGVTASSVLKELGLSGMDAGQIAALPPGRLREIADTIGKSGKPEIQTAIAQSNAAQGAGWQPDEVMSRDIASLEMVSKLTTKTKTSAQTWKDIGLDSDTLSKQFETLTGTLEKFNANITELKDTQAAGTEVSKESIKAYKDASKDWKASAVSIEKAAAMQRGIEAVTGILGVSPLDKGATAAYAKLSPGQQQTVNEIMSGVNSAAQAANAANIELLQQDAEERKMRSPAARLGSTMRNVFGGWGMMYMGRAVGYGVSAMTEGGAEAAQFADSERMAARMSGLAPISATQTSIAMGMYQRAMIRQGEGGLSGLTRLRAQLSGGPLGDALNAGQLGLSATLGATFMLGEALPAFGMSAATAASTAGIAGLAIGGVAAAAYPFLQGYARANDPRAAGVSAAASSIRASGRAGDQIPFAQQVVNNFTALGEVWRGTANWQQFASGTTQVDLTTNQAIEAANVIGGRGYFAPASPEAVARYEELQKRIDQVPWGRANFEAFGGGVTKEELKFIQDFEDNRNMYKNEETAKQWRQADKDMMYGFSQEQYFLGLKAEAQSEQGYFKEISPESAVIAGYQLEAAGVRDRDRILALGKKYDAGVDPGMAKQVLAASRLGITQENYATALEALPTSDIGQMNLQAGTSFLGNLSNAYVRQLGYSNTQEFMELAQGKGAQWANSTWAPGAQMQSQLKEKYSLYGFQAPDYTVSRDTGRRGSGTTIQGTATLEELGRMSDEERRQVYAQSGIYAKSVQAYESITETYGRAGIEMAQKFMETINKGGAIAGMAAGPAMGAMQNAFFMTGGNMGVASQIGSSIMNAYMTPGQYGYGNTLMDAMSGNPYAMQRAMQTNPAMAAMMQQQGFGQLVDVNRQGQVTGLPLYTTNMTMAQAQQVWGNATNTPVAQAATQGYTPMMSSTGQALYGTRGIQAMMSDTSYQYQLDQFGLQQAGLNLQQSYMTQTWGVQDRMRELNNRQAEWGFSNQIAGLNLNRSQFYENQAVNKRSFTMQRQFAQKDWEYQDQVRDLQWQWKQEDYGEEVRFMTGRNRRLAERQMRRDTTMYNLEEDHIKDQRKQQQELWKMEEERFKLTKKHFEENYHFQLQAIEKQRAFYQERQKLELQMEQIQRRYQQEQMKLQQQQINLQRQYAEEMHRAQTQMMELSNSVQDTVAAWEQAWRYSELAAEVLKQLATDLQNAANNTTAPTTNAFGGEFSAGQQMWVGEMGPELVRFNTGGKVIPAPINPWQKTVLDNKVSESQSGTGTIFLNINVGNERLARLVIDAVSQEISV